MNHRFLKISARFFSVLAWLSLAIGLVVAIVLFSGGGQPDTPRAAGAAGVLLGVIYFFVFGAFSAIIQLLLEIESKIKS